MLDAVAPSCLSFNPWPATGISCRHISIVSESSQSGHVYSFGWPQPFPEKGEGRISELWENDYTQKIALAFCLGFGGFPFKTHILLHKSHVGPGRVEISKNCRNLVENWSEFGRKFETKMKKCCRNSEFWSKFGRKFKRMLELK